MKSKKNWYTLLEIMIVLWVIIIIMTITMKFSSSRIDDLQAQTSKDDFKNNYEQLLLTNMSSNYNNNERYDKMTISIKSWTNWFNYFLENETKQEKTNTWYYNSKFKITKLKINNNETNQIDAELIPYKIWCKINNQTWVATIETNAKNKHHCFQIKTDTCKIELINCSKLYPNQ